MRYHPEEKERCAAERLVRSRERRTLHPLSKEGIHYGKSAKKSEVDHHRPCHRCRHRRCRTLHRFWVHSRPCSGSIATPTTESCNDECQHCFTRWDLESWGRLCGWFSRTGIVLGAEWHYRRTNECCDWLARHFTPRDLLGSFQVDLSKLTIGGKPNASFFQMLDTRKDPDATLTLTKPIVFTSIPTNGQAISLQATVSLAMHGITHAVTFTVMARSNGSVLEATGSVPLLASDWRIQSPFGIQNNALIEFLVVLRRG